MKKTILFLPILFCSCSWVLTHPSEDAEIVKIAEEIGKDVYDYEMGQPVSPGPEQPQTK